MTGPSLTVFFAALLTGCMCGIFLETKAAYRKPRRRGRQSGSKARMSASKLIALCVLAVDGSATFTVLYLCYLAILRDYSGALPYLTTLIGALQAASGYVLGHYFKKATVENSKGGITYDAALKAEASVPQSETGDL